MQLYERDDGIFRVQAYTEKRQDGATRYRVRWTWRGVGQRSTRSAKTAAGAVGAAEDLWLAYAEGELDAPDPEPLTLGELATRWLDSVEVRPLTRANRATTVNQLLAVLGAARKPSALTRGAVRAFMESIAHKAPRTRRKQFGDVKALGRWAVRKGWLGTDPTAALDLKFDVPVGVRPWMGPEEWPAYLDACGPSHAIRSAFVLETGLRRQEVSHATWDWIVRGVGRPSIHVQPDPTTGWKPKTKHGVRPVPLSDRAQAALDDARQRWGSTGRIFSDHVAPAVADSTGWAGYTHAACKRGAVTDTDFHGLRRSCGARWLLGGARLIEVARLLGHGSVVVTERAYAGIADSHLSSVVGRMEPVVAVPMLSQKRLEPRK